MFTVVFTGNLGSDVDFQYTKEGKPYAKMSVAVYKGKEAPPMWVRVVLFGRPSEILATNAPRKGDKVVVQASRPLDVTMYEKKGGGVDVSIDLIADWVETGARTELGVPNKKSR